LSQNQAAQLIALAGSAQEARAAHAPARHALLQKLMPLLEQQMSHMIHDQQVPGEIGEQIAAVEADLQTLDDTISADPLKYAADARQLLTEPQLQILTGGDEALRAAEEMLTWVRTLSDEDFTGEARTNADALADPEIGLPADMLYAIFTQARALPADEYAEKIGPLAARLAPLYAPGEETEDVLIAELLVNPRFVPLMQRRLQYLSAGGGDG
jgi:hypothetical protein